MYTILVSSTHLYSQKQGAQDVSILR